MRKRAAAEPHPPPGEAWMGCDDDYNHAYCCRKDPNVEDRDYGQSYCPLHLITGRPDQQEIDVGVQEMEEDEYEVWGLAHGL